jgi:hypothetical protein
MMSIVRISMIRLFLLTVCLYGISFAQPTTPGYAGKMDGVRSWDLPNAPSGTRPDQAWHSVGSAPDGDIYISGHDHASNSMLYRLNQKDDVLSWVGDARTASQAANNWQNGETCQKFHIRPTYYNGKVYAASLDRSTLDNAWQSTRGFHWYAYDLAAKTFTDLSVSEPKGVAAEHLQVLTIQIDPKLGIMYGATIPECKIVSYDIAKKATTVLGKPSQWAAQNYVYSNRYMFVDSRGRLYFSAGNERAQWNMGENKAVFDKMYYYDPASGFGELTSFPLQGANCLEVGQWNRDHTKCYVSSDQGHLYCFTDAGATWTFLGRPNFDTGPKVWSIWVSPDGEKLYIGRGEGGSVIVEYDLATKTARDICSIGEVDASAGSTAFMTGYDTWDRNGNIYTANFSMNDGRGTILTRINPVRIKVAKGLLPALVQVSVTSANNELTIARAGGAAASALKVLYQVDGLSTSGIIVQSTYGEVTIPADQASVTVAAGTIQRPSAAGIASSMFYVESDGNDYIAGAQKSVALSGSSAVVHGAFTTKSANTTKLLESYTAGNGATIMKLNLPIATHIKLSIYTMQGKVLKVLVDEQLSRGAHEMPWVNTEGSGMYTARIEAGRESVFQNFVVLK